MSRRRILLVGPAFHGYTEVVGEALGRRGHTVLVHHYDANETVGAKVRTKVTVELPARLGRDEGWRALRRRATETSLTVLAAAAPDVVLVIRGDALDDRFWDAALAMRARTHLWLYDELRRMRHDAATLAVVDHLTSYSRGDVATLVAQGRPATYLPNGFDACAVVEPVASDEVLFVGARYPNRERLLLDLAERGLPVRAVGRDWSHHPADRLRTWRVGRPSLPAGRDVPREAAYGLMAGARANVNVHHDQDGFTMRTFEIAGAGGLQLVDRPDVAEVYEPGREVLVFGGPDEAAEHVRRAAAEPAWATDIARAARARTLAEHTVDHRVAVLESLWD